MAIDLASSGSPSWHYCVASVKNKKNQKVKLSLWVLNVDDGALINALRNGQTVADVLKALCSSSSVSVEKVNWEFSSGRMQRSHSQSWLNETNETATWYQVQFICLLLFVRVFVCIDFLLTVLFEWDWTRNSMYTDYKIYSTSYIHKNDLAFLGM